MTASGITRPPTRLHPRQRKSTRMVSRLPRLALALLVFGLCFVIGSSIALTPQTPEEPTAEASQTRRRTEGVSPLVQEELASETPQTREELTAERDRLWQQAKEFATKQNCSEAVRSGETSLALQCRHFADRPMDTCRML